MFKNIDDKTGLVRLFWQDVRERVALVDSKFASIIDELSPGKEFPLYLAYYPYGATIADPEVLNLPKDQGLSGFTLADNDVPQVLLKDLGYAKNSLPMGMVLENTMEYSIELKNKDTTMPWLVYSPGSFFPFTRILAEKNQRIYAPNAALSVTSGVRSVLMLPNIGCSIQHGGLQRDYNIQTAAPKSLNEHWHIFKELVNSPAAECDWRSCILFFSENWAEKIQNDESWLKLNCYLYRLAWRNTEYQRNRAFYEINFSLIQEKRNLKPNPYLVDVARHLFATAIGAAPGYIPAHDESGLPLKLLQEIYIDSYGLKKYLPIIMQAAHYNFENDNFPVYYSLKHPSSYIFSPKSRKAFSAIVELRELDHIMKIFTEEWQKQNEMCSDTIMSQITKNAEFNYFHNEVDRYDIVEKSSTIPNLDSRFNHIAAEFTEKENAIFASDAPFVRGCVSIRNNLC